MNLNFVRETTMLVKAIFQSLKILIFVSVSFLILSPSPSLSQSSDSKDLVKIGVIAPLTGGQARNGDDVAKMIAILQEHFSKLSKKHNYQFILEDGKCGAGNSSTTAAMKFINVDHVNFLLTSCSGETLQAGPLAQKSGVLTISVLALHPDVKKIGDYVFRTYIDIDESISRFSDYLKKHVKGKIALITEENSFTFSIRDLLKKYLGDKLVYSEDFAADTGDFNTLLSRVKYSGAEAVYYNTMSEVTLISIINQARAIRLGLKEYSYSVPEMGAFMKAVGKKAVGLEFLGPPIISNESDEYKTVHQEFLRKHPEGPSYDYLLRTTFDGAKSIFDGVESVGADPSKVKEFLKTYRGHGALGNIEYNEWRDIKDKHFVLKQIMEDGSFGVIDELNN